MIVFLDAARTNDNLDGDIVRAARSSTVRHDGGRTPTSSSAPDIEATENFSDGA